MVVTTVVTRDEMVYKKEKKKANEEKVKNVKEREKKM